MAGRIVALFVLALLALFLLVGPTVAETTAAGICELFPSLEC